VTGTRGGSVAGIELVDDVAPTELQLLRGAISTNRSRLTALLTNADLAFTRAVCRMGDNESEFNLQLCAPSFEGTGGEYNVAPTELQLCKGTASTNRSRLTALLTNVDLAFTHAVCWMGG
jgi:hypothetical protein